MTTDTELLAGIAAADADAHPAPPIDTRALADAARVDLRAWTVRQPWASAIVGQPGGNGGPKSVENRTTRVNRRGLVLIHAGLRYDLDAASRSWVMCQWLTSGSATPSTMPTGAVVGAAVIEDCHRCDGDCSEWAEQGAWHVRLGRRFALAQPVACRGALGFWRPQPAALAAVLEQHGTAS